MGWKVVRRSVCQSPSLRIGAMVLDGGSSTGQGLTATPSNDDNDDERIHTTFYTSITYVQAPR